MRTAAREPEHALSIRMTNDRVLVRRPGTEGDRRTKGGLLIPATAREASKRCVWVEVVAVGPNVGNIEANDLILVQADAGLEADIRDEEYLLLREPDVHAVASDRVDGGTGLYL